MNKKTYTSPIFEEETITTDFLMSSAETGSTEDGELWFSASALWN